MTQCPPRGPAHNYQGEDASKCHLSPSSAPNAGPPTEPSSSSPVRFLPVEIAGTSSTCRAPQPDSFPSYSPRHLAGARRHRSSSQPRRGDPSRHQSSSQPRQPPPLRHPGLLPAPSPRQGLLAQSRGLLRSLRSSDRAANHPLRPTRQLTTLPCHPHQSAQEPQRAPADQKQPAGRAFRAEPPPLRGRAAGRFADAPRGAPPPGSCR